MIFWNKQKRNEKKERKIPYMKEITKIHAFHKTIKDYSQEQLQALTEKLRENTSMKVEQRKIQAFAIIYEVIRRTLQVTPYDVQLSGGIALREGNIAQMRTGEGKTITALIPAFWGYVDKQQTYVITVNEYLAERDHAQAQNVFNYLGIEVGLVLKDMSIPEKKESYSKPITYVTNTEFAFDYLRDNIAMRAEDLMQKSFDFVIIDEADLILIDEAKNPVIISGNSRDNLKYVESAKHFVNTLVEDEDYIMDEDYHIPLLTDEGFDKGTAFFGCEITDHSALYNAVNQAMLAKFKFKKDVDYIVRDGEIHIVDKYTGRVLPGRRFQNGLHQALEMKENVEVQPENTTIATTTYQSLFRKFKVKSGMTGTAIESKDEFKNIYGMDVVVIPTNKPVVRVDHPDKLFSTKKDKYDYLLSIVQEKYVKGQPILIGTTSVKESEDVSEILTKANIPFHLLNAKNDKEESKIVEKAGEKDAVTISTNMAGRGTDIKLTEEVERLGGLCVIGTSRNESKRIDRQLIGRSGRQGQVGESMFLTSLEDELVLFHSTNKVEKFKNRKDLIFPIEDEIASELFDDIQQVIDSQHASIRKLQFQMDDILHYQREYVYGLRRKILLNGLKPERLKEVAQKAVECLVTPYLEISPEPYEWDFESFKQDVKTKIGIDIVLENEREALEDLTSKKLIQLITEEIVSSIESIVETVGEPEKFYQEIGKHVALQIIDKYWITFLYEIDMYKCGFGMSSIGEQDPIRKFSIDMHQMFQQLEQEAIIEFLIRLNRMRTQFASSIMVMTM